MRASTRHKPKPTTAQMNRTKGHFRIRRRGEVGLFRHIHVWFHSYENPLAREMKAGGDVLGLAELVVGSDSLLSGGGDEVDVV